MNDKTIGLLAKLEMAVLDVRDSDSFKAYLRVAARFHKYSFGNILLIASQRPDATQVAGFRTWNALGRHVRRGEKGIAIVVPFRSLKQRDDGEVEERVRFGTGYVFDVSQTEGDDLPGFEVPMLVGDDGAGLFELLADLARREDFTLDRRVRPGEDAAGFWLPATRTIWVAPHLSRAQAAKTLAHEVAHAFQSSRRRSRCCSLPAPAIAA